MKEWAIVGMVVMAGGWLVWWGDNHGFSSRELAAMKMELVTANARIAGFTQRDDQAAIDADVLRDEGYKRAVSELSITDKCIVTDAMVRAFSRIVR